MGIHLCIQTTNGRDHPEWDFTRMHGDRDFVQLMFDLPSAKAGEVGEYTRPADIGAWRTAVAEVEWPNEGRYEALLDILEREPSYWIYVSY
jgi:hypothetical protein